MMKRIRMRAADLKAEILFVMDHNPLTAAAAFAGVGAVLGVVIGAVLA